MALLTKARRSTKADREILVKEQDVDPERTKNAEANSPKKAKKVATAHEGPQR
jgi:hypothetical protein